MGHIKEFKDLEIKEKLITEAQGYFARGETQKENLGVWVNHPRFLFRKFLHEVQMLKRFEHPNVANLKGVNFQPLSIVLDFIPTKTLAELIAGGMIPMNLGRDFSQQHSNHNSFRHSHWTRSCKGVTLPSQFM